MAIKTNAGGDAVIKPKVTRKGVHAKTKSSSSKSSKLYKKTYNGQG